MKKKCVFAALAAAFCVFLSACASAPKIREPALSLQYVVVKSINFDGVNMLAHLNIKNENPFPVPFPEIDWALIIQDKLFINGVIKYKDALKAGATTSVEIPFTVYYEGLYSLFNSLVNADEAPYRMDINTTFTLPVVGSKTFGLQHSGTLPMVKLPSLSFAGARFDNIGLNGVDFTLTWAIENKNTFAISLDRLNYDFSVNGASWVKGSAPQRFSLPPKKSTQVPLKVSVGSLGMVRDIVTMAQGGRSAPFKCLGEAVLRPELSGLEALTLPFNFSGATNFGK